MRRRRVRALLPVLVPVPVPVLVLVPVLLSVCGAQLHSSAPSVPSVPSVPSPQNVAVRCEDQRPTVSWDYSSQRPTIFTVRLLDDKSLSAQTTDHELDLSHFVWNSPERIFDYLYVTVTAEQGLEQSERCKSPSFSYNRYKTTHVTCHLKFPEVELSADGAEATLSFENPLHFYKELRTIENSATLTLTITTADRSEERRCGPERVCKFSVDLPGDAEPCVNLTGTIQHGAEEILVLHRDPVCAAASAASTELWLAAILSVVVLVGVISLLTVVICKFRAWVFPKLPTPQALVSSSSHRPAALRSETVYSAVQITGTRPRTVLDPENLSPEPLKVQEEDQVLIQTDHDPNYSTESLESVKTETVSLHSSSSEAEPSNYERRNQVEVDPSEDQAPDQGPHQGPEHLIEMDLSGDLVKGYTG